MMKQDTRKNMKLARTNMEREVRMLMLILQQIEEDKLPEQKTLQLYKFLFAKREEDYVSNQY